MSGVVELTAKTGNAFLVDGDDGLILVDTGTLKGLDGLLRAISDTGRAPSDIERIVLTHAHPDHVQAAPELRARTSARVLVHRADADWLAAGRVPAEGRSGASGRNYDRLSVAHWTPFTVDDTVEDGDRVGGLRVIHTPGHSPGHIALLHETSRTLLVGDAVFRHKRLGLGPAGFAADPAAQAAGLARLPRDVTAVGFGHGATLTEIETFHAFLDKA
jgi:glyoxylase-like metal-dependent hydrolase (beta-lactamase superfamily II)